MEGILYCPVDSQSKEREINLFLLMEVTVTTAVTNKESYTRLFTYKNYIDEETLMRSVEFHT